MGGLCTGAGAILGSFGVVGGFSTCKVVAVDFEAITFGIRYRTAQTANAENVRIKKMRISAKV